jgi:hypothetical protein
MDLEASEGERRFRVMVHLGNYALWLAGLFPDYIAARHLRKGGPDVAYYDALGRRASAWPAITPWRTGTASTASCGRPRNASPPSAAR